jgi:hypothetical protein
MLYFTFRFTLQFHPMNLRQWKESTGFSLKQIAGLAGFTNHTRIAKHLSGLQRISFEDADAYIKASKGLITLAEIIEEGKENAADYIRRNRKIPRFKRMEGANDKPGRRSADRGKRSGAKAAR